MITYFVVQSFEQARKGTIFANEPIQAHDEIHAVRLAERLAATKAGVIAFRRTGDPATGDYEDAVVLASFGTFVFYEEDAIALAC